MSVGTNSRGFNIAGVDMSNIPDFTIIKVTPYELPSKDIEAINLALADGQVIVNSQWGDRKITVEGLFQCDTISAFDVARDALVEAIDSKRDVALEVWQSNAPRLYYGIVENAVFDSEAKGVKNVNCVITIKCSLPFGIDTTSTNLLLESNITDTVKQFDISAGGSTYSPAKVLMTLNDVTPGTEETITLTFDMGSEVRQISITYPFSDGDTIVIDGERTRVYVNSTSVEYVGRMPIVRKNTLLTILTTHTDIDYNLDINHKRRWL